MSKAELASPKGGASPSGRTSPTARSPSPTRRDTQHDDRKKVLSRVEFLAALFHIAVFKYVLPKKEGDVSEGVRRLVERDLQPGVQSPHVSLLLWPALTFSHHRSPLLTLARLSSPYSSSSPSLTFSHLLSPSLACVPSHSASRSHRPLKHLRHSKRLPSQPLLPKGCLQGAVAIQGIAQASILGIERRGWGGRPGR